MDILDSFEVVVGLEDVNETKPDPEGINLALAKLHSRPEQTLFVGDSFADISAAKNAGCSSCHAQWGITNFANLRSDYVAPTPERLLGIIIPHSIT